MRRAIAGAGLGLLLAFGTAAAQTFATDNPVLRRIWVLGVDSSQTYEISQPLFDSIGPRLTGSPGYKSAADWLIALYQKWGIQARAEQYGTWRGWRRGSAHIDLVAPRVRTLEATMLSWSPGTGGKPVRGEVIQLPDLADSVAFRAWLPSVKGKFVAISFPQPSCRPDSEWATTALPASWTKFREARATAQTAWQQRVTKAAFNARLLQLALDSAGAAGILTSTWTTGWGTDRIFNTWSQHAPVMDLSCEDYGLVSRLAENHQGPVVQLVAESQNLGDVPAFNIVAEIPGTELPNEYVMLSAHFDSWDGGSGATDNGTGTVTMAEAMRILKLAYPAPRRTILVGHWASEENGLDGSKAFVADHPDIVSHLQALFNQDNGTGRVVNLSASGYPDAAGSLARWLAQVPSEITRNITFGVHGHAGGRRDRPRVVRLRRRTGVRPRLDQLGLLPLHLAHHPRHLRQDRLRRPEVERGAHGDAGVSRLRGPAERLAREADGVPGAGRLRPRRSPARVLADLRGAAAQHERLPAGGVAARGATAAAAEPAAAPAPELGVAGRE